MKIPYKALRFQDGLQGVYVVVNQVLEFKKVDIIYDDVGFFISSIDSNNGELVQLYDDIVTEGTDLYMRENPSIPDLHLQGNIREIRERVGLDGIQKTEGQQTTFLLWR